MASFRSASLVFSFATLMVVSRLFATPDASRVS